MNVAQKSTAGFKGAFIALHTVAKTVEKHL